MTTPRGDTGTASSADAATSRFEVRTTSDSHFAWIRTRLALERTMMAWARTSVSLIWFGFTIVQFFERFGKMEGVRDAARPEMPRYLGLALIASGVLALAIAIQQYRQTIRYLNSKGFDPISGVPEIKAHSALLVVSIPL